MVGNNFVSNAGEITETQNMNESCIYGLFFYQNIQLVLFDFVLIVVAKE